MSRSFPSTRSARRVLLTELAAVSSPAGFVALSSEKLKHLKTVLRVEKGAPLQIADGSGRLFEGEMDFQDDRGGVNIGTCLTQETRPAGCELLLCLPKNATTDWVVEKAVECGVTRIRPIASSRSIVKPDPKELTKYVRRWQTIMDGAVEQCETLWRPEISEPVKWGLSPSKELSLIFASELRSENRADLGSTMKILQDAFRENPSRACRLLIGPEGGFSAEERKEAVSAGFQEASLGELVLRVETAVISALTLIRASRSCFVRSGRE